MTTITIDRATVEQALEALKRLIVGSEYEEAIEAEQAITALRAALAQQAEPVQEPVAWRCACGANLYIDEYGHPASRAVPVSYGQTLEEAMRETREKAQAYEAGWKAGLAHRAELVEPVAWMVYTEGGTSAYVTDNPTDLVGAYRALPLYTAPPQRTMVPLTEEEIDAEWHELDGEASALFKRVIRKFARAVEKASWEKNK